MTPATAPKMLAALLVQHAQLVPSLTNPRKRFDKDRLQELADSMAPPVGILEPLVVRPFDPVKMIGRDAAAAANMKHVGPFYEIIAGERRWRAAGLAKIDEIPIVVREIPDDQVIRLQLIENKNREDVHPLDEAEAMEKLLKLNKAETPKTIAASIGMSERYVQNRLHYLRLIPDVQAAFREERITAGHADLIMRLSPADQKRALDACFVAAFDFEGVDVKESQRGYAYDLEPLRDEGAKPGSIPVQRLVSVRELDGWIKGGIKLDVTPGSPETRFFPELRDAIAPKPILPGVSQNVTQPAPTLLQVADTFEFHPAKGDTTPPPLRQDEWKPIDGKKGRCEFAQRAVVVLGKRRAQLLDVCIAKGKCKTHWPETLKQPTAKPRQKQQWEIDSERRAAKRREETKRWKAVKPIAVKLAKEALAKLKPGPTADRLLYEQVLDVVGPMTRVSKTKPTVVEMARALVLDLLDDDMGSDTPDRFADQVAKPLGIDMKKVFADAERKARFAKMSDQEAGAAALREKKQEPKKAAKPPIPPQVKQQMKRFRKPAAPRKRKAGAKK